MSQFIINPYNYAAGAVGGWVELGRTTLGTSGASISVSSLADKRYYMVLSNILPTGGAVSEYFRLNADSGSTHANRNSYNGGADQTFTSAGQNYWYLGSGGGTTHSNNSFGVGYVVNLSSKEKLIQNWFNEQNTAGAGNAPNRGETALKWSNTSNAVDEVQFVDTGAGSYNTNSEVVVLGWDPADTHTNNFWEELASVELSSAGDDLSSGTISAKKYLWVQAWYKNNGAADINNLPRFNGDSGSNYASRRSQNGGAEITRINRTWIDIESGSQTAKFVNMFIVNNQSNEKLIIFEQMDYGATGSGTTPNRSEGVAKWTNTSNQITEINFKQLDVGDYTAGSIIKVWGSD